MSDGGIGPDSAPADGIDDSLWPEDINDWESWPDQIDLDYLVTRIDSLEVATLRDFILSDRFYFGEDSIISIAPLALLQQLVQDPAKYVRSALAASAHTPPKILAMLAQDDSDDVVSTVASNPNTPTSSLDALAQCGSESVWEGLASNPQTPPNVLAALATRFFEIGRNSKWPDPRLTWLAENPNTPGDSLRILADGPTQQRIAVARNPSTPPDVLTALSKDKAKTVKLAVLDNPNAPKEIKSALLDTQASSPSAKLSVEERAELILNENINSDTLTEYLDDKAMGVRIAAAIRGAELGLIDPNECAKFLRKQAQGRGAGALIRRWQATQADAVLDVLIAGRFTDQLEAIASDSSTPHAIVRRLLDEKVPGAAWYLVNRAEITPDELDVLASAPSHSFQWFAAPDNVSVGQVYANNRITCYPQVVVALHPLTRPDTLEKLRKARSKYVRAALAQRPDIGALARLSKDKEVLVRVAVAAQTQTPSDILEKLAMDPEQEVREAVRTNPAASESARATAALLRR